jgi:signal transduction histidine kinase
LDLDPRNFHSFSFKKFAHVQPILYDGKPVGYLKLVSSTSHMREELVLYFKVFTFAALLALLTSSQISRRLQNSVSQPILALVAASRSSASGRQMVQVQAPKAEPEIAELVEAFNKMVQEIDRRARELEQANLTLESRVNQRTRELAEAILEAQRVRHLAESASESKTRFLNNMSHELRTPLTAIIGYTRLLAEELEKGNLDGATRDVATVEFSAKHLLGLISNILDLSKIESGKMEVQCETFDPLQLLTDCARTFEPLCHENGNRLELDLQSLPSAINTDKTKLRQILFNLLSNAAKFTESGVITLRARKNEPYFEIRVCDTGAGMNPDQIKRAFEPFQSAGQSRLVEGSGLGLTIVYSFCRMLQGTFEIKSEPGKGTQCIARLPLHPFHHS